MRPSPLPAFEDNYIWTLAGADGASIIVDPGDAAPVFAAMERGLRPAAVLVTHHHADHCGGVAALRQRWPQLPVFAPEDERIAFDCERVGEGGQVRSHGMEFEVMAVPGHTRSHIAFFGEGCLFSGDTLFSLGCGRLFEGTPSQMLGSLRRLGRLPGDTLVCCGHEYTLSNAAFAVVADPTNGALQARCLEIDAMRQTGQPTLPVTLSSELACNPFLRTHTPAIGAAVTRRLGRQPADEVETFAELRRWKDQFRA